MFTRHYVAFVRFQGGSLRRALRGSFAMAGPAQAATARRGGGLAPAAAGGCAGAGGVGAAVAVHHRNASTDSGLAYKGGPW